MNALLDDLHLHTICQAAKCPNLGECFAQGTATFLILGNICTRNCAFCGVAKGNPQTPDSDEPRRISEAVSRLGLKYVVITSVTRDDIPDGGARHFAKTVQAIHSGPCLCQSVKQPTATNIVHYLGVVDYIGSCRLLDRLAKARAAGEIPDTVLLLEHPPVFTIGRSGYKPEDILVSREILAREGISVYHTNRGGGVTYHGHGQLICYPVFDLQRKGLTVRQYIHGLEEVVILTLAQFNLTARCSSMPGISVGNEEICAIGIYVSHNITKHGFALNVSSNLKHFSYIAPCGALGKGITSVAQLLGYELPLQAFVEPLMDSFRSVFNLDITLQSPKLLEKYHEK